MRKPFPTVTRLFLLVIFYLLCVTYQRCTWNLCSYQILVSRVYTGNTMRPTQRAFYSLFSAACFLPCHTKNIPSIDAVILGLYLFCVSLESLIITSEDRAGYDSNKNKDKNKSIGNNRNFKERERISCSKMSPTTTTKNNNKKKKKNHNDGVDETTTTNDDVVVDDDTVYDVCIIGAGPGGLATLSAIYSPYALDRSMAENQKESAARRLEQQRQQQGRGHQRKKVCVVDNHSAWLESWSNNFNMLSIDYLRSPVLAHPDMFDPNALLSYAVMNHRDEGELLESGCFDIKSLLGLGQSQIGLWKLPSTALFYDFCMNLSKSNELSHTFIGNSYVVDMNQNDDKCFQLTLSSRNDVVDGMKQKSIHISAKSVVLSMGPIGRPIVPSFVKKIPQWRFWNQRPQKQSSPSFVVPAQDEEKEEDEATSKKKKLPVVVVVGGGLTAVQVALKEVRKYHQDTTTKGPREVKKRKRSSRPRVLLISKRPLAEKHFDINIEWFNRRIANKCMADFYNHPMEERKAALRDARRGGSVPPLYMRQIEKAEQDGYLKCLVGHVKVCDDLPNSKNDNGVENENARLIHIYETIVDKSKKKVADDKEDADADNGDSTKNSSSFSSFWVDEVIVACGIEPNCDAEESSSSSLIGKIQSKWPTRMEGGLPCVTQDLRWKDGLDIFVIGSLGALNIGPDAGNLMGIRRAAQLIANALGCRSWLREKVLSNRFDALLGSDSDDSDSD